MNTLSAFEQRIEARLSSSPRVSLLMIFAEAAKRFGTTNRIRSNKVSPKAAPSWLLGDAASHGDFGNGRVMAHWPDGRLVVRFESVAKSRLVWPSHLNR